MKNGPARERGQHRVASSYGRYGKVPSLYPSGSGWPALRRAVLVELHSARSAAFGHGYRDEERDEAAVRAATAAVGE